jgi:hypothetical protein
VYGVLGVEIRGEGRGGKVTRHQKCSEQQQIFLTHMPWVKMFRLAKQRWYVCSLLLPLLLQLCSCNEEVMGEQGGRLRCTLFSCLANSAGYLTTTKPKPALCTTNDYHAHDCNPYQLVPGHTHLLLVPGHTHLSASSWPHPPLC